MTDTNFTEDDLSFETLFKNGTCLTYDPFDPQGVFHYALELKKEYCRENNVKYALMKTKAELSSGQLQPNFHYFSNGILIHTKDTDLQRVHKMLAIRNLPIRRIYDLSQIYDYWRAGRYMRNLSERANLLYSYKEDITIAPFPKIDELIKDCFANGNILLTAAKEENVNLNPNRFYKMYLQLQKYNFILCIY